MGEVHRGGPSRFRNGEERQRPYSNTNKPIKLSGIFLKKMIIYKKK